MIALQNEHEGHLIIIFSYNIIVVEDLLDIVLFFLYMIIKDKILKKVQDYNTFKLGMY